MKEPDRCPCIRLQTVRKVVIVNRYPMVKVAILTATENGFVKRTPVQTYPAKAVQTQGVVSIKVSDRKTVKSGWCCFRLNRKWRDHLISDKALW